MLSSRLPGLLYRKHYQSLRKQGLRYFSKSPSQDSQQTMNGISVQQTEKVDLSEGTLIRIAIKPTINSVCHYTKSSDPTLDHFLNSLFNTPRICKPNEFSFLYISSKRNDISFNPQTKTFISNPLFHY